MIRHRPASLIKAESLDEPNEAESLDELGEPEFSEEGEEAREA